MTDRLVRAQSPSEFFKEHVDAACSRQRLRVSEPASFYLVNLLAGVTRETPKPEDGEVVRGADGGPTGLLKESAAGLVGRHVPPPTEEEQYRALKLRLDQAA